MKSSNCFVKLALVIALFFISAPALAGNLNDAERLINLGNKVALEDARWELTKYLGKHNDIKGNRLMARCLFRMQFETDAMNSLQRVINLGGSKQILFEEFSLAFIDANKRGHFWTAKTYLDHMVVYSNKPFGAGNFYLDIGYKALKKKAIKAAEDCFVAAKPFIKAEKLEAKAGDGFLYMAAVGYKTAEMKEIATSLVGEARIKQVWPDSQIKTIYEGTFDDSKIKADGNIDVVLKGHIQQGDKLVVKAIIEGKSTFDAEEVYVWKGKNFNPQWDTTTNGEFTKTIEVNATNCIQTIWIEKGKNIKAHVMVVREIPSKPNLDKLLALK